MKPKMASVTLLAVGIALLYLLFQWRGAQQAARAIDQAALAYTYQRFNVLGDEPKILVSRPITAQELSQLSLSAVQFAGAEPPLQLIVLEGDFDASKFRRNHMPRDPSVPQIVHYIVYVYDLQAGGPTMIEISPTREYFNAILGAERNSR